MTISIIDIFPALWKGINITITVLIASAIFGYSLAFIAGLCRLSSNPILRGFTTFYVEVFRGTSLVVQLFWLFYALPILFNINLGNEFWAGSLAIGLNYGAYMSEIVRGSFLSVAKGKTEASTDLNLSRFQRIRLVILHNTVLMLFLSFGYYLITM